jgi:hypothetical protein
MSQVRDSRFFPLLSLGWASSATKPMSFQLRLFPSLVAYPATTTHKATIKDSFPTSNTFISILSVSFTYRPSRYGLADLTIVHPKHLKGRSSSFFCEER